MLSEETKQKNPELVNLKMKAPINNVILSVVLQKRALIHWLCARRDPIHKKYNNIYTFTGAERKSTCKNTVWSIFTVVSSGTEHVPDTSPEKKARRRPPPSAPNNKLKLNRKIGVFLAQ